MRPVPLGKIANYHRQANEHHNLYLVLRFEQWVKDKITNKILLTNFHEALLNLILTNTDTKSEMPMSARHRLKLRTAALLLSLDLPTNSATDSLLKDVTTRSQLSSVRVLIDSLIYRHLSRNVSFLKELSFIIADQTVKMQVVTSIILILLVAYEENKLEANIVRQIELLAMSQMSGVRTLAQYFLVRTKVSVFSESLRENEDVCLFAEKFDESFGKFRDICVNKYSIIQLTTLNEEYSELMPFDVMQAFNDILNEFATKIEEKAGKEGNSWKLLVSENELQVVVKENFQKKYIPGLELEKQKQRKRLDIVIVASLVEKMPNIGGVVRTAEVFNLGMVVLPSLRMLKDNSFKAAASSADKWLPLTECHPKDLNKLLWTYAKLGYKLVGLEQTESSVSLQKVKFKEKTVVVLGNEKLGIPHDTIGLLNEAVVIEQFGKVRSLNVHVSAAIMMAEISNQLNIN